MKNAPLNIKSDLLEGMSNRFISILLTLCIFLILCIISSIVADDVLASTLKILGFGLSTSLGLLILVSMPYAIEIYLNLKQKSRKQ